MQSAKTRPGADCDSDHQLLIAKFRLKLKKTRKNTKLARSDLNQVIAEWLIGFPTFFNLSLDFAIRSS